MPRLDETSDIGIDRLVDDVDRLGDCAADLSRDLEQPGGAGTKYYAN